MLKLDYGHYEIIVVNDGSKDNTSEVMREKFEMYLVPPAFPVNIPTEKVRGYFKSKKYDNLLFIDKENGGKADALNCGINASKFAYFLALDADTLIAKDGLLRAMTTLLVEKDVVAVGGTIGVINDCTFKNGVVSKVNFPKSMLAGIQIVEYMRAYLFGRVGWNYIGGNMIISGAFGLFDKQTVLECGGYLADTVGEDMELTVRIHHNEKIRGNPYKVYCLPDTVAWTEVPEDINVLARQRERWHRGLLDALYRHKGMAFNPRYGVIGTFAFPFFIFGELLSPFIEFLGWMIFIGALVFNIVDYNFFALFFVASVGFSLILTTTSMLLTQVSLGQYHTKVDFLKMIIYVILENFGYRQLTLIWRLKGFYKYLIGDKTWGEMTRTGFAKSEDDDDDGDEVDDVQNRLEGNA
jgi:cellulose synthase/poly-beta-1,6-N-acetylglucosamine synthase-like glycosyltransferase